ncbi:MAG: capsular exopolysaccharide synthesis family protein [Planctomycetota bacterium]|jgi:capsular exopolysaccharide synthesis family protein
MMGEQFDLKDANAVFDVKAFLFKLLRFWPLFLVTLGIALAIAHYINVRKLPVYTMSNMISIKDDQNPFFTANTSLTFNWGGTTDKVNTAIITLKSRSHNEKVVERLQFYINYSVDGDYQREDAFGKVPFVFEATKAAPQMVNKTFTVTFKDPETFVLAAPFSGGNVKMQNYTSKDFTTVPTPSEAFSQEYKVGAPVDLPFLKGVIYGTPDNAVRVGIPYYVSLSEFDNAVKQYLGVNVSPDSPGSSVLRLRMNGTNKNKLVAYLNSSVKVLSDVVLERKNLFATKTIQFIDSSLSTKAIELKGVESELNNYKNRNAIFDLDKEGSEANSKLSGLENSKADIERQLSYFNVLERYLEGRNDYSEVPAPSVAGISESSIVSGVGRIVVLAEERQKLSYTFKESAPVFADIDRQINAVKQILFENIRSSKSLLNSETKEILIDMRTYESEIRRLPKEQQDLLKIERRYNLSQGSYNIFLAKQSEARLVKAANVSDVLVIDSAKDTGGNQIGPDTKLNYMLALFFGLLIPFVFVLILAFFDNKITSVKDIERQSRIPILGVIGKSSLENGLVVLRRPKSAISESFRAIRSSLQFMYKKQGVTGAKTVLLTSSVSGEGKTFTSINIASVFALSGKKTVLVGLDLRKPKIFGDFAINNSKGVVNCLINDATIEEITQGTEIPSLDVITSGPIPPNPSELLMGEGMERFMAQLKDKYDYIILDSPPLGLVSDALELARYADATVYLIRQNYTKKGMLSVINQKYKKGEIENVSFVLNFYDVKGTYGYGYGYGYNYGSYGDGYHENEEKPTGILHRFRKKKKTN